jgi:hypothetical protein
VLARDPAADKLVSVFANVNSVMEFAYWQRGDLVVRERHAHAANMVHAVRAATCGF